MNPGDISVISVTQNSRGVYFLLATGKGGTPASVKRAAPESVGADGHTFLCLTCIRNDDCAHAHVAQMHFARYGAALAPQAPSV